MERELKELLTPPGLLKEFFDQSPIWADLQAVMDDWIEAIRDQLENGSGELTVRQLDRLGGNAEALRKFKHVDAYILQKEEKHGE